MAVKLFLNSKPVEFQSWKFPVGEVGVKLPADFFSDWDATNLARIHFVFEGNHDEVFVVLNLIDALQRGGASSHQIFLRIPYLPYSRQDRVCHPGESFALDVFLKIFASTGVTIQTFDVHSKVSTDYKMVVNVPQYVCAANIPDSFNFLVGPDAGSKEKVAEVAAMHATDFVVLEKQRTDVGIKITVPEGVKLYGNVCIVDDLADGGGTFISAAKAIRESQPDVKSLSLYVTHGFFTKGIDELSKVFDNVYCYFNYSSDEAVNSFVKEI